MKVLGQIYEVMMRELQILRQNHIYRFCMVLFPILVIIFFTTMLDDGLPTSMPVGIVDLDNTSTTRALERKLDGFQMSKVVAHYPSVAEARQAIQRNEIYGFLYIPSLPTAQDILLLHLHHHGCRFHDYEGYEDRLQSWLSSVRTSHHAC